MIKRTLDSPMLILAVPLLLVFLPASGQERQLAAQEWPGTAEINGTIAVSPAGERPSRLRHDPLQERYAPHGATGDVLMTGEMSSAEWKLSERAVVYLEGSFPEQGFSVPEKRPVLNQKNVEFHPRVLPILVGTTVDFPNRDNLFHNVFSYSQTKEFDLGRYPKNDSRSVTFAKPGIVRVYCDIHAHMNATILVLQNPYFAVPTEKGSYSIRNIPEGKYTLVFWYDRDIVERRPVVLKAGERLEMDFTY